jgi:hypothetical protein
MKKILVPLFIALSLIVLSGCASNAEVIGSGPMVTRGFELDGFTEVAISGGYYLTWEQSSRTYLTVEMQENLFEHFSVDVRGGTLFIESERDFVVQSGYTPRLIINAPTLEGVTIDGAVNASEWSTVNSRHFAMNINGGGSVRIDLEVENLDITVYGGATIELGGNASTATIAIYGASNIDAVGLQTRSADISVNGAGDVHIAVSDYLTAEISGVGNVRYLGSPVVTRNITGLGSVRSID